LIYLIVGIFYIFTGTSEDVKNEMLKNYTATDVVRDFGNGVTPTQAVEAAQAALVVVGVIFIVLMVLSIINIIVAFAARKKETKVLFILNIVFGFVSSCIVNAVGGILAIIASNRDSSQLE
jgi:hypothetical protein